MRNRLHTSLRNGALSFVFAGLSVIAFPMFAISDTMLPSPLNLRIGGPSEVPREGTKWHPGHYVYVTKSEDIPVIISDSRQYPIFRGIQRAYYWEELETSKGQYDFSLITKDIELLRDSGRYLIIQLQYKTFSANNPKVPSYLKTPEYDGGVYYSGPEVGTKQWNLRLWNEKVRARLIALVTALATEFDGHPGLALINTPESGPAKPLAGYDEDLFNNWADYRNRYYQGLFELVPVLRSVFIKTPAIMYYNDGTQKAPDVERLANTVGIGIGSPDTWVNAFEYNTFYASGYDLMKRVKGSVPLGLGSQWPNYDKQSHSGPAAIPHENPENPIPAIYDFNRNVIGTNFIFWERRPEYWDQVRALWSSLYSKDPDDLAGGLSSQCPELISPCVEYGGD